VAVSPVLHPEKGKGEGKKKKKEKKRGGKIKQTADDFGVLEGRRSSRPGRGGGKR